jgi:hypothetical protein
MKQALELIVTICQLSRQPTRRIYSILDVALKGLGLTANQRAREADELLRKAREYTQARRDRQEANTNPDRSTR